MSKLKVNELDTKTGTTITVAAGKTIAGTDIIDTAQIAAGAVGTTELDSSLDLSGKTLTLPATLPATIGTNITQLPAANVTGTLPANTLGNVDTSGIEANKNDIALLAFQTQANGSLARYNLVDQSVDSFEDASGVDASASTNEQRNASNYYEGVTAGTVTTSFTTAGADTWTAPAATTTAEVLVVGGGGGGGVGSSSGGGGAGGLVYQASRPVTGNTTYNLTVGAGGAGGAGGVATNGGSSTFDAITSVGGGGGGSRNHPHPGIAGASGGGGASDSGGGGTTYPGGAATQGSSDGQPGFGNAGGSGRHVGGSWEGGGGGGGAGGAGVNASQPVPTGGPGGVGKQYNLADGSTQVYYAGGGGGNGNSKGTGGSGGGGAGTGGTGGAGTDGFGGGGGAGNSAGGVGGTGLVMLRYASVIEGGDMTLVSTAQTAQAQPTKGDVVLTYNNGTGTTTLNTDLIASVSRDNGTTYTAATLALQGTTGGHNIATTHDLDISGQPAGTSMRWKVVTANQSSGSKTTRIQAVSLGWS